MSTVLRLLEFSDYGVTFKAKGGESFATSSADGTQGVGSSTLTSNHAVCFLITSDSDCGSASDRF